MKRLLIILSALLLAACAGLGSLLEKPHVKLAGLELEQVKLLEQRFVVTLRVSNPNNVSVTIDGVDFDLFLNGGAVASGASREAVTLPSQGDAYVKIRVNTRLDQLWKQLRAQQKQGGPLNYEIKGRLHAGWLPGGLPFSRHGELKALSRGMAKFKPTEE